eukprot:5205178-Pyramimonas_sp.AAC.1
MDTTTAFSHTLSNHLIVMQGHNGPAVRCDTSVMWCQQWEYACYHGIFVYPYRLGKCDASITRV